MQSWIGPFRGFTNLTTLFLTSNKFTALPANVFEGLQNLEWIILANNQLSELPAGVFGGLQKLTELHLHQNQLATLPVNVFEGLQNLKRLYLYGNQLSGTKEQFRALHGLGNQIYILWDPQNPSAGLQQLHLLRRGYFPYLSQAHSSFFRI
jgi:Leucine-rich repeat (LRR) protein